MTSSTRPIFVVGAPRSGTTLLRSMLDAHPNICCPTWETGIFDRLSLFVSGDYKKPRGEEANFCSVSREDIIRWMRRCTVELMELLTARSGKPRWGEKTPAHVLHVELIQEVFPEAQFVHIVRNGKDVVRSLQNVDWSPRKIRWSVERWTKSVRAGRGAGAKLGPERYAEVRYEDLTSEPERAMKDLCEFLQEPFAPQMLEFDKPENNSWGLSMEKIQSHPVNKSKYRELSFLQRLVLKAKAGRLMRELGYQ